MKSLALLLITGYTSSEAFVVPSSSTCHHTTALFSAHKSSTTNYKDSGVRVGGNDFPQQPFHAAPVSFVPPPPPQTLEAPPIDLPREAPPAPPLAMPETRPPPTTSAAPKNYAPPPQWYENKFQRRKVIKENNSGPELWYEPTSPAIASPIKRVQGAGSRTNWQTDPLSKSSQVMLNSGRPYSPIQAEVKLHSGPADTPRKMRVYSEDGFARPVQASFTNSRAYTQNLEIQNQGPMEFPLEASITETTADVIELGAQIFQTVPTKMCKIQGQSLKTFSFDAFTEEIRVNLESDGLPLMAKIEVLQGPGDERQVFEVTSDDGSPWEGLIAIPGGTSSLLIRNTGPMEFPIYCSAEAQVYTRMP